MEQMKRMKEENKTNKSKEMEEGVKGLLLPCLWLRKPEFSRCEEKSHNQILPTAEIIADLIWTEMKVWAEAPLNRI